MVESKVSLGDYERCDPILTSSKGIIYYVEILKDEKGKWWYRINGETSYRLDHWSKEEAEEDYCKPENITARQVEWMRSYGFFD